MNRIEVNSSTIKTVGYDPETQTLEVSFNSGGIYSYANVPQEVYDRFLASESKGSFFATWIRANYEVTHLNPRPKEESHGENQKSENASTASEAKTCRKKAAKKARKRIS